MPHRQIGNKQNGRTCKRWKRGQLWWRRTLRGRWRQAARWRALYSLASEEIDNGRRRLRYLSRICGELSNKDWCVYCIWRQGDFKWRDFFSHLKGPVCGNKQINEWNNEQWKWWLPAERRWRRRKSRRPQSSEEAGLLLPLSVFQFWGKDFLQRCPFLPHGCQSIA